MKTKMAFNRTSLTVDSRPEQQLSDIKLVNSLRTDDSTVNLLTLCSPPYSTFRIYAMASDKPDEQLVHVHYISTPTRAESFVEDYYCSASRANRVRVVAAIKDGDAMMSSRAAARATLTCTAATTDRSGPTNKTWVRYERCRLSKRRATPTRCLYSNDGADANVYSVA